MRTTIFTLCDYAKDYNGQLSIMGTFNRIVSDKFPADPRSFCLACQFEVKDHTKDDHYVNISVKENSTGNLILPTQELRLSVSQNNSDRRLVTNLILNIDRFVFQNPGTYTFEVISDNNKNDIELYVDKV